MSRLLQQKTTRVAFRVALTTQQICDSMLAAIQAETAYRRRIFDDSEGLRNALTNFAKFLNGSEPIRRVGCMMCGTCGNGKTTVLYAFQNLLNRWVNTGMFEDEKVGGSIPWGLQIVNAKELAVSAKEDINQYRKFKNRNMLAIDDMGTEAVDVISYGNTLNPVADLIEHRYNEQLFTLITTNLTPAQVREKYGARIADRFNEMMSVVIFENGSYRD